MWVTLEASGTDVEITWGHEGGPVIKYHIGAQTLRNQIARVRAALEELTRSHIQGDADLARKGSCQLAREGVRLRHVLVGAESSADGHWQTLEHLIRAEMQKPSPELSVQVGPRTCYPIGLIYEGEPEDAPGERTPRGSVAGFWAAKARVSYMLTAVPPSAFERPFGRDSFRLISVVNREVLRGVRSIVSKDKFAEFEQLMDFPVGSAFQLDRLEALIEEAQPFNAILHFLVHGREQRLLLSDTEEIDTIDLSMHLEKLAGRRRDERNKTFSLVFLNACETSISDLDDGFFQAATQDGICGFVGTEAKVPAKLALEVGHAFLHRVVKRGLSVGDAMQEVLTDYWPYSLLYSCYATPDFTVEGEPA